VIRRLQVRDEHEAQRDAEEELHLQERTTAAALERVDELMTRLTPKIGEDRARTWADRIRGPLLARTHTMTQTIRAEEQEEADRGRQRAETFQHVRHEVTQVQRRVLMEERDKGHVDEDVVRAVLQELDYQEAAGAHTWIARL
jgi:CPA1 family monovalent cation:H+ antiporter